jgi:hypothetical protein
MLKLSSSPIHQSTSRYLTAIKINIKTKDLNQKTRPRKNIKNITITNSNYNHKNKKTLILMSKNYILSILTFMTISANMHTVPAYTMN